MKKQLIVLAIGMCTAIPSASYSAEWGVDVLGTPEFGYDDNVFLNEDETDSFTFRVSPTLVLSRAEQNMNSSVNLGYSIQRFSSVSSLDAQNPFIQFDTRYSMERAEFGLSASYTEDNIRNQAAQDTGVFATDATSTSRALSPSISYQLTARDSLSTSYDYSERQFSTDQFDDNESKSVTVGWNHLFTERFTGGLSLTATNFQIEGLEFSSDDDSYNVSSYVGYQLSELWFIDASIGYRRLETNRTQNTGVSDSDNTTGATFDVSTSYETELDTISMALSRGLLPSGVNGVNEQDSVEITWSRQLSETLTANLTTRYLETRTASTQFNEQTRENISIAPSLNWQLNSRLGIDFNYRFVEQKGDNFEGADSNAISVSMTYDWDGYKISR
jgi:hypothetical protein